MFCVFAFTEIIRYINYDVPMGGAIYVGRIDPLTLAMHHSIVRSFPNNVAANCDCGGAFGGNS